MTKQLIALATATLALASVGMAATPMTHGKMMKHSAMKPMAGKKVAFCAKCNMYYSPTDAKKMHMKDSMGDTLKMVSMSKVPKTAKMGHMGGKMMPMKKAM